MGVLLWDWTKGVIWNIVINKTLNNTSIGLPDSGTELCINKVPIFHYKDPGLSLLEGKPLSTFMVVPPLCW